MPLWDKVKQVYQAALAQPPAERLSFLDRECAGDEPLRREVLSLLDHEQNAAQFIEEPAIVVAAKAAADHDTVFSVGHKLGHYEIVSLLGTGGMGEVYEAYDPRLDRTVALKILPAEASADQEGVD